MPPPTNVHKVCVDRIEEDIAVLLLEDDTELPVPARILPDGANEGSWLLLRLSVDVQETEARRRSVEERRKRIGADDDGGDLDL